MTLLIACILIYNFHMNPAWYVAAVAVWWLHLLWNSNNKNK